MAFASRFGQRCEVFWDRITVLFYTFRARFPHAEPTDTARRKGQRPTSRRPTRHVASADSPRQVAFRGVPFSVLPHEDAVPAVANCKGKAVFRGNVSKKQKLLSQWGDSKFGQDGYLDRAQTHPAERRARLWILCFKQIHTCLCCLQFPSHKMKGSRIIIQIWLAVLAY